MYSVLAVMPVFLGDTRLLVKPRVALLGCCSRGDSLKRVKTAWVYTYGETEQLVKEALGYGWP
jgi:hypothetical protein